MSAQVPTSLVVPSRAGDHPPVSLLMGDEQAVAYLLSLGAPDGVIAQQLGLTPTAIATIVERIGLRLLDAWPRSDEATAEQADRVVAALWSR